MALHHPPVRIGIAELDDIRLPPADAAALGVVLARFPQVRRVVCGHVHRGMVGALGGLPVFTCPSVYLQARLDLAGGEIDLIPGAPAIGRTCCWTTGRSCRTCTRWGEGRRRPATAPSGTRVVGAALANRRSKREGTPPPDEPAGRVRR